MKDKQIHGKDTTDWTYLPITDDKMVTEDDIVSYYKEPAIYHGFTVICSGHCGIRCAQGLWICNVCNHVECDRCIDDYSLNRHRSDGNSFCRRCGALDSFREFIRSEKSGIHGVSEEEFESFSQSRDLRRILCYDDFHISLIRRIIFELKRKYQHIRYYNP